MQVPLVVDLDGTLIHTDMLHETALKVWREYPLTSLRMPLWLSRGKAALKQQLAHRTHFDAASLPYNETLVEWLLSEKQAGRSLVLCTASDQRIADGIASHLQLFDEVMASDGETNLSGPNKAAALVARFGERGFDYAGNSRKDLPVWAQARKAIVVNAPSGLAQQARTCTEVEREFPQPLSSPSAWLWNWIKLIRVHQWLKNLLLFVPMIAAHEFDNPQAWSALLLAFFAFSLCASAVYITNDLLDLESDRLHPRKRLRPMARGFIPAWQGVLGVPLLLTVSALLAWHAGSEFFGWLVVYFVLTCSYSMGLKRLVLIDCLTLAMLYTLRIVAGAAAAGTDLTFWLLTESVFLFLSLAFVKRYAELTQQAPNSAGRVHGRGYYTSDAPLIQALGLTSGYIAVLVLALYLNSAGVSELYRNPLYVWAAIPCMLFWISWMWMQANRGQMHDDPLVFAVKDKASLIAGLGFASALILGAAGSQ